MLPKFTISGLIETANSHDSLFKKCITSILLGILYTEHMLLSISDEARTQSSFPLINCANSVKALKLL